MRSQEKNPKTLPKPSILGSYGRMTRSRAATLSTVNAASQLTLQALSTPRSQQASGTSTATSYLEDSDASVVASSSSRTSTFEYANESGTGSSDYEDEDVQIDSSPEQSEASSDAESIFDPEPPAAKRVKVWKLHEPTVKAPSTKDPSTTEDPPATVVPKKPPPPDRQIKIKDAWNFKSGVNENLPPISNIVEIFDDLTEKAMDLGLGKAIQHLGARKLKLATMCSGTESPLLALQLVSESLKKYHGINLDVEHLFSAEIVPFKQAYIERNFHPSIIFRDIRELVKSDTASTAYGSEVQIPSDVDILVAGFSCVDFSRLNSVQKQLTTQGESGDTFYSVLDYAKEKRPALVILENVLNAPWDEIAEYWVEDADYAAMYVKVDTKQYYIPHTRQRGYMLCIDKRRLNSSSDSIAKWAKLMATFQRPASSPVEAFLLSEDDTRVHLAREEMIKSANGEEKSGRDVDWTLCQGRHQDYRAEHHLGTKKPLTQWQQGGSSIFPDYAWIDWNKAQTDRVKDTCDLSYLRSAKRGYDLEFKTRSIELSQNIDRYLDTTPPGITSCITPTGQPYITTRGRPLIGLESLALQGLPIDSLLLTRETTNQLQDLAGNAMTSTVIGAAILSALIVGHQALKGAKAARTTTQQQISDSSGDDTRLKELPLELGTYKQTAIASLLRDAERSARLCYCEGQNSLTSRQLQRCTECSHTTCKKCGGYPSHVYRALDPSTFNVRLSPQDFQEKVKKLLPMRLILSGLGGQQLDQCRTGAAAPVQEEIWKQYLSAIIPALGEELRFHSLKRNQKWTIYYDGHSSRLELLLDSHAVEWRLYAKVSKQEPVDSTLRQLLQHPFARMTRTASSLFGGRWQFRVPSTTQIPIIIEGKDRLTRSWESRIGLQDPEFADKQVWTELSVKVAQPSAAPLELDISGDYKWLPDCGTASRGLHRRVSGHDSIPVFFFLDPERTGKSAKDQFVFSTDINRLSHGDIRSTIARVESSWRPSARIGPEHVNCSTFGEWIDCPSTALRPFASSNATFAVPADGFHVAIVKGTSSAAHSANSVNKNCAAAVNTLLRCKVPLGNVSEIGQNKDVWLAVDQTNERALFASFAWLTEKARDLNGFPQTWRPLQLPANFNSCQECAPDRPAIAWRLDENVKPPKIVPYEDPREAGLYERAIKARPGPFVTRVHINENNVGVLTIGLNVCTLVHRAVANLCGDTTSHGLEVSWRLDTKFIWQAQISLPQFTFPNNTDDAQSAQPPHWIGHLRSEQLRSLSWMIGREAADVEPFFEEEIEEAILPQMGWRAEGRARRSRQIRGGVLADQVGYGKTAITLGLIDTQFCENNRVPPVPGNGKIPIKATLIVVPAHLIPQWKREIEKFLGQAYKLLVIQTQTKMGNCNINDFIEADIIIAAWSMFDNDTYLEKLAAFAALPEAPSSGGRAFQAWYQRALQRISKHVDTLIASGAHSLAGMLETELAAAEEDEEILKFVPSKRLRGAAYASAQAARLGSKGASVEVKGPVESITGKGKKRKAEAVDVPTDKPVYLQKKATASGQDFFGLKSSAAKANWVKVRCPPFQLFEFNRVVVDEYTYLKDKDFTLVTTLQANYRWVLSGTPPHDDFADIKVMAGFLQVQLGIDDDAAGIMKSRNIKAIRKDRTTAEQFQSFRQVHSPDWHLNQHRVAQLFLNQCVRRNKPEIGEILCQEQLVPIKLPAAERASYMELNQQLISQDMKLSRGGGAKIDSDRANRLMEIMGSSKSPEEALLKRCSHFTLEDLRKNRKNGSQDCDLIVQARSNQYEATVAALKVNLKHATWLKRECTKEHEHFTKWTRSVSANAFGDLGTSDVLMKLVRTAEKEYSKLHENIFYRQPPSVEDLSATESKDEAKDEAKEKLGEAAPISKAPSKQKAVKAMKGVKAGRVLKKSKAPSKKGFRKQAVVQAGSDLDGDSSGVPLAGITSIESKNTRPIRLETEPEKVKALRTLTGQLRNLAKELVSRTRALRFFEVVNAVQRWQTDLSAGRASSRAPTCSKCKSVAQDPSAIAILGLCGHTACESCLAAPERGGECVTIGCDAPAHNYHIQKAIELGQDDRKARVGRHDGEKMDDVMDLIENKIPKKDQVLVFVQFNDLMEKVSEALDHHGIKHWALTEGSRRHAYKVMEDFQINDTKDKKKVLILNVADESAAGANLTNANHVIFLSPLLADSRQHYESAMEQAVGRVLRYGQLKSVQIYRYLALKTIDVDIIQGRTQKKLGRVDGEWGLHHEDAIPESEKQDWGGGTVSAQYLSDED